MSCEFKHAERQFYKTHGTHMRALTTPGSLGRVMQEEGAARRWIEMEEERLAENIAEEEHLYQRAHQEWYGSEATGDPRPSCPGTTHRLGQAAFLVLEALLGALVGIQIFNFTAPFAAAFGVLITFSLFFAMKVFLHVLITDSGEKAQTKFRLAQRIFATCFGAWSVSVLLALLVARLASDLPNVDEIYAVLLTVLTLVSPAAAAALGVAKEIRG